MGNDPINAEEIAEQEKGIEALRNMPPEAKEYLCHHLKNSLAPIINFAALYLDNGAPVPLGHLEMMKQCAEHAVADLRRIGC